MGHSMNTLTSIELLGRSAQALRHRSIHLSAALVVLGVQSCAPGFGPEDDAAIRAVMAEQEAAWNKGDIPAYMEGYSNDVCFTGGNGTTCGRAEVSENYIRKYPNKATMGQLVFGVDDLLAAGDRHAWLTGTWQLLRSADTLSGGFSLLWVKEGDNWKILRDHSY